MWDFLDIFRNFIDLPLQASSICYSIYRTDAFTGWICAYATQPVSTLAVRYLYSNVLLLLAVLFWGLACTAAIFRSARRISRPISELIQKMQASSGDVPAPDVQNEWEYLERTYSSLLSRKKELILMPLADQGFRELSLSQPIQSLANLQGLTIRCLYNEHHTAFGQALGLETVSMDIADVYLALQKGGIQGEENPYA